MQHEIITAVISGMLSAVPWGIVLFLFSRSLKNRDKLEVKLREDVEEMKVSIAVLEEKLMGAIEKLDNLSSMAGLNG